MASLQLYHQRWSFSGVSFRANIPGFINDLPDEVLSRIGIYADDTTIPVFVSLFFLRWHQLELDMRSIVEWGDRWLVTCDATKTKLLSFNRNPLVGGDEWH